MAALGQDRLRRQPTRLPAIHPRNRDDKAAGDGDHDRTPKKLQSGANEDDFPPGALDIPANPPRPGSVNSGPANDGNDGASRESGPTEIGPVGAREAQPERLPV